MSFLSQGAFGLKKFAVESSRYLFSQLECVRNYALAKENYGSLNYTITEEKYESLKYRL